MDKFAIQISTPHRHNAENLLANFIRAIRVTAKKSYRKIPQEPFCDGAQSER